MHLLLSLLLLVLHGELHGLLFEGGLLLGGLLLRHYMEQREWTRVTETGACMFLGAAFNVAFWTFSRLKSGGSENWRFSISMSENMHDVIYFGLLPPIIFEAGFVMRKRSFFANFGTILLYAVVGTLISILCTGGLILSCKGCGGLFHIKIGNEVVFSVNTS